MFRYQQLVTQEKYLAGHECLPRPGQDGQVNFWVDLQKVMGGIARTHQTGLTETQWSSGNYARYTRVRIADVVKVRAN
jgi:hypothetical protein